MNVEVRDARLDEIPAITTLIEEHAQIAFGETELNEEEIRTWFALPRLWIQVAERDGELAGYLDVRNDGDSHFSVDARTRLTRTDPIHGGRFWSQRPHPR